MNKKTIKNLITFCLAGLSSAAVYAADGQGFAPTYYPSGLTNMDVILPNAPGSSQAALQFIVNYSCLAMNLRGAGKPVKVSNSTSTALDALTAYIQMNSCPSGKTPPCYVQVTTPSSVVRNVDPTAIVTAGSASVNGDTNAVSNFGIGVRSIGNGVQDYYAYGNVPAYKSTSTVTSQGNVVAGSQIKVQSIFFCQKVTSGGGTCAGAPGDKTMASVDSSTTFNVSTSGQLTVNAQLPLLLGSGTNASCDYMSPLMLFFSDEMPVYSGASTFALEGSQQRHSWPQAKADGYFLAVDSHHDRSIRDGSQLFGNSKFGNGFEALKDFLKKKKGVLTAKDPEFKQLVLWNDANGDGVSQPEEVKTLDEMGVVSIELKYDPKPARSLGNSEGRGESVFTFKTKDGKKKKGSVIDVYFKDL